MERVRELVEQYGEVDLPLVGEDGNAFSIMGRAERQMRRADWPKEARDEVMAAFTSGDYDNVLCCAMILAGDSA